MFNVDELGDSVRENFIGMVVEAEFPCNCRMCEEGTKRLIEMGREPRQTDRIHLVIKPLTQYDNFQHAWYNKSRIIWSGHGAFTLALNKKLGFVPKGSTEEQWKQVRRFLLGNVFEWESVDIVSFVNRNLPEEKREKRIPKSLPPALKGAKEVWVPIRHIKEDELESLGVIDVKEFYENAKKEYKSRVEEADVDELIAEQFGGADTVLDI